MAYEFPTCKICGQKATRMDLHLQDHRDNPKRTEKAKHKALAKAKK